MLLEEALVATSPGVGFGPAGEGYLRLALVENELRIKQALRGIRSMMRSGKAESMAEMAAKELED